MHSPLLLLFQLSLCCHKLLSDFTQFSVRIKPCLLLSLHIIAQRSLPGVMASVCCLHIKAVAVASISMGPPGKQHVQQGHMPHHTPHTTHIHNRTPVMLLTCPVWFSSASPVLWPDWTRPLPTQYASLQADSVPQQATGELSPIQCHVVPTAVAVCPPPASAYLFGLKHRGGRLCREEVKADLCIVQTVYILSFWKQVGAAYASALLCRWHDAKLHLV